MNTSNLTITEIREAIEKSEAVPAAHPVKLLFLPNFTDTTNLADMAAVYKRVSEKAVDTLVVVESYTDELKQKLCLPAGASFHTPFGDIAVNQALRDELCDEDDDFFITDSVGNDTTGLTTHLMFAKAAFGDFKAVSVQICDYDTAIIRELVFALDELLGDRKDLPVFCCNIPADARGELDLVMNLVQQQNEVGLKQYLQSDKKIKIGARALIAGLILAGRWNLEVDFRSAAGPSPYLNGLAGVSVGQPA